MRTFTRFVALLALSGLLLAVAATSGAAGGFEPFPEGWNDGASTDFGYGEVEYLSCPDAGTTPCPEVQWKYTEKENGNGRTDIKATIKLADVRYIKANPADPGPAYFDVLSGIFTNQVTIYVNDPEVDEDDVLVSFVGKWSWQIRTDDGQIYQTTGQIRDFTDGAAPWDYHRWNGPIIEP